MNDPRDERRFASTLRSAINARGLPLETLSQKMADQGHDLSIATLSYWQNGRSLPGRAASFAALDPLEELLGLPRGSLRAAADGDRRPRIGGGPPDVLWGDRDLAVLVQEYALDLGLNWSDGLERYAEHAVLRVDENGGQIEQVIRQTVRARRPGITAVPQAFWWDHPEVEGSIVGTVGCHVGRELRSRDHRLVVAALELDPPPLEGQTFLYEYSCRENASPPAAVEWELGVSTPVNVLHLEVEFHPSAVPARVVAQDSAGGEVTTTDIDLVGNRVSRVLTNIPRGSHGFRWEW